MTCAADLALHHLIALDSQRVQLRRTQAQLRAVVGCGDETAARTAIVAANLALRSIATTIIELRRLVVAHDHGCGHGVASIAELALRARQWVILFHLHAVRQALHAERHEPAEAGPPLFCGSVLSIGDLISHVTGAFLRANERWRVFRTPRHADESAGDAELRRLRYVTSVRIATHELRTLGTDPQVARFLRLAQARTALRASGAAIEAAFRLAVDEIDGAAPGPVDPSTVDAIGEHP